MYAQKKSIDNVHIVRERDRQRFRELLAVFSLGVPLGLFLLLFTWQNIEVIRLGREATRLQEVRRDLEDENRKLAVQIEQTIALDHVEERAADLRLHPVEDGALVIVTPSRSSRNVARASRREARP